MPRYEITGPDGHRYEVSAPEGASEADVLAHVQAEAAKSPAGSKPTTPRAPAGKPVDESAVGISAEDRRAYAEALPGTPEGMKARKAIEDKYGGYNAFIQKYDPVGEALGKSTPALALIAAAAAGGPVTGAVLDAGAAALTSPAARSIAMESLKWLGRGALGAGGFEFARRMAGHK
jgi:hypothetical protein